MLGKRKIHKKYIEGVYAKEAAGSNLHMASRQTNRKASQTPLRRA